MAQVLLCYPQLNSIPDCRNILKHASDYIDLSDDDEIRVYGDSSFPILRLKIVDCYYFNLHYLCIEKKRDNCDYFDCCDDVYKTKEYYQFVFDYIKKFQASDAAKIDKKGGRY